MKKIDFTQPGGFPLTQDRLNDMQNAYLDMLAAIAGVGNPGAAPMIMSGMVATVAGPNVTITDGWFYYQGVVVRFTGSTHTLSGSLVPVITVATTSSSLVYYNATSPMVIAEKTATWAPGASGISTATVFPFATMVPFGRENAWSSVNIATMAAVGGASGTLYYRKNYLSNTLELRGQIVVSNPNNLNFGGAPETSQVLATLPAGYIPNNVAYFRLPLLSGIVAQVDPGYTGVTPTQPWSYISDVNGSLDTSGNFNVTLVKWDTSVGGGPVVPYTVYWNTVVPLD